MTHAPTVEFWRKIGLLQSAKFVCQVEIVENGFSSHSKFNFSVKTKTDLPVSIYWGETHAECVAWCEWHRMDYSNE